MRWFYWLRWRHKTGPEPAALESLGVDVLALFADEDAIHDPDAYRRRLAEAGWPQPAPKENL